MAQLRDPKVKPLVALEDKLRSTSVLRFRETRMTADGIELEAVDIQTGQVALITISPINQGQCPVCSHVSHLDAPRCEAIATFTKEPCACRSVYGRFPPPNRTQDELDGKARPAWMRRSDLTSTREPSSEARRRTGQSLGANGSDDADVAAAGRSGEGTASSSGPRSPLARADELVDLEAEKLADYHDGVRMRG